VRILSFLKVGIVTHFYDKIKVAVVDLDADLSNGDKIKFVKNDEDLFEQVVSSMQVEHEKIESAKKGDTIGLKVEGDVKEGAEVYKEQ
jgi:putative protease